MAAILKGESGGEWESSAGTDVGERDALRFVLDDAPVDVFLVAQVQRPERRAELHDGDIGRVWKAGHRRDAHVEESAERRWGGEYQTGEHDLGADGHLAVGVDEKREMPFLPVVRTIVICTVSRSISGPIWISAMAVPYPMSESAGQPVGPAAASVCVEHVARPSSLNAKSRSTG